MSSTDMNSIRENRFLLVLLVAGIIGLLGCHGSEPLNKRANGFRAKSIRVYKRKTMPAQVVLQCTRTPVTPVQVVPLSGGGEDYLYEIDGQKISYLDPPTHFDPVAASDAQLQEYGFPPRPLLPQDLKIWNSEVVNYKNSFPVTSMSPTSCKSPSGGFPGVCKGLALPTRASISQIGTWQAGILSSDPGLGSASLPAVDTDADSVSDLFAAICTLLPPVLIQRPHSCQVDVGVYYHVGFSVGGMVVATATIDPTGCGDISFHDPSGRYHTDIVNEFGPLGVLGALRGILANAVGTNEATLFPGRQSS